MYAMGENRKLGIYDENNFREKFCFKISEMLLSLGFMFLAGN